MVPVGGRPILWHIMKLYAHRGFKDFILCLGYKGEIIKDYFRNYLWHTSDVTLRLGKNPALRYHTTPDEEDWTVTLLETGAETQTGGRLRRALAHVTDPDFFFTYGDAVTDADPAAALDFHRSHGAVATVTAVRPQGRFGELAMEGNTVTAFQEKPEQEQGYINGGFMVLNRRISEYLGTDDRCVFEREPMESRCAGTTPGVLPRWLLAMHGHLPRTAVARPDVGRGTGSVEGLEALNEAFAIFWLDRPE